MSIKILVAALLAALPCRAAEPPAVAFVHHVYVHGVPFAEAAGFSPAEAASLVKLLDDTRERKYWSNVVTVLGASGDKSAYKTLAAFLKRPGKDPMTPEEYRARLAVPLALGYLANRTDDARALDDVAAGADAGTWKLGWKGPGGLDDVARNQDLAAASAWGLAVSGKPRAAERLKELAAKGAGDKRLLAEALRVHGEVVAKGLRGYYDEAQFQRPMTPKKRRQ